MSITYCVHSMNRLSDLKTTLPHNLECLSRHADVDLVLLNYHSRDELHEWIRSHFLVAIEQGRFTYAYEGSARCFHMSKSKNIAHKLGQGDYLINLDSDNFIAEDEVSFLKTLIAKKPTALFHLWSGVPYDGTHGKIALPRDVFFYLRGYDESLLPVGFQDIDLLERAHRSGLEVLRPFVDSGGGFFEKTPKLPVPKALENKKEETMRFIGLDLPWAEIERINKWLSDQRIRKYGPAANPYAWGNAELELNFSKIIRI